MRSILYERLPGDGERENDGMRRENVEQRIHPILVEQHQAEQDQPTGQKARNIVRQSRHHRPRLTNRSSMASRPSITPAPRNSATRNTRILATTVSNSASRAPRPMSL